MHHFELNFLFKEVIKVTPEKEKLFLEKEILGFGMMHAGNKILVSIIFDEGEEIDLEPSEIMNLITNGKISVRNIAMFEELRDEFLAYFPLKIK